MQGKFENRRFSKVSESDRQIRNKFKFDYDAGEDLLFIYDPAKKSLGSIEFGDLVLDLEKGGSVIGVEIFNASAYLSELTGRRITKPQLLAIRSASLSITEMKGTVIIKMALPINGREVPATIAVQSTRYRSPALLCAAAHSN